jgi:2-hydroxychromene-2-carboxylate isomerase
VIDDNRRHVCTRLSGSNRSRPIQEVEVIREVLESVAGAEVAEKTLAGVNGVGKEILAKNTQEALDQGCFGVPYFIGEFLDVDSL